LNDADDIISLTNLCAGYGGGFELENINLQIRKGDFWFFLGPNGSGKTTLLRTLLGEIKLSKGAMYIHPMIRSGERVGFLPQRFEAAPSLPITVREFVDLGKANLSSARSKELSSTQSVLGWFGLEDSAEKSFWSLSGGQRQRALLARAMSRDPELLILDEPTTGLDVHSKDQMLDELRKFHQNQGTILLVTHDMDLAIAYATHLAVFYNGRVCVEQADERLRQQALGLHDLERNFYDKLSVAREDEGC